MLRRQVWGPSNPSLSHTCLLSKAPSLYDSLAPAVHGSEGLVPLSVKQKARLEARVRMTLSRHFAPPMQQLVKVMIIDAII
jgi:hypothetical protein